MSSIMPSNSLPNEGCCAAHSAARPVFWLRSLCFLAIAFLVAASNALAIEDNDCFICHNDPSLTKTLENGKTISLYVDQEVYTHSVHAATTCVACHNDINELPHQEGLKKVECGTCHVETEAFEKSLHGKALTTGDPDVSGCVDCHGTHETRATSDPLSMTNPKNLPETCGKCHSDAGLAERHMFTVAKPSDLYVNSVHGKAVISGETSDAGQTAATCSDCHTAHDILPRFDPASPIFSMNIPKTCGKCHEQITKEFESSIHGRALAAGVKDAPNCTDCHGEHAIEPAHAEASSVSLRNVSRKTCPSCHDNEQLMTRYGVPMNRQASYMDSYHGMASEAGSTVVASCTSCHGAHTILPASDPASSIAKANLPMTCGQCHENAGPNFAEGPVHIVPTDPDQKALGVVRIVYFWLIGILLGAMVLHNTLMMLRHMSVKLIQEWKVAGTYRRFSPGMVLGHLVLMISFIVLAVSGFALRYPNHWLMHWMFLTESGFEMRGIVHRVAAIVFTVLMVVNVAYLAFTKGGRKELRTLLIVPKDALDVVRNLAYAVGLSKSKPQFARYSYKEKLEYWGLLWGSLLMIVTGFGMWYADALMRYWPKVAIDVAALVHFYEAWLAVGTIVVWHLYYMIFDPETYPMNWSWLTGRITKEDLKERHALDYERAMRDGEIQIENGEADGLKPSEPSPSVPAPEAE
jgi:cytochrome b subunit of formate dehydrogenase